MKLTIAPDGSVNSELPIGDDLSTQQYVRTAVHTTLHELGFVIHEEWEMDDDSIEIEIEDPDLEITHDSEGG